MTIDKKMSIIDVLRVNRDTAPILMSYGMHCLGCPHATAESLENACAAHGVSADELVEKLNEFLAKAEQ